MLGLSFLNSIPAIIIPAYQPTSSLIDLVTELTKDIQQRIVIVNDGSSWDCQPVFTALSEIENVVVLHHAVNLGKGQALKTAFNYVLLHSQGDLPGIVTADADGQHSPKDIQALVRQLILNSKVLWVGSRKLNKDVPFRSRFGNSLTRKIFQWLIGKSVCDTQSGLRAIPRSMLVDLLRIPTSRYEYELDMLVHCTRNRIEIHEIPIQTIYIEGNKSSHFNPIIDSIKIYFVFLRYIAGALASAFIDFFCFVLFYFISAKIFLSLVLARLFSGIFNFVLCRKIIFKSGQRIAFEALKYLSLAVFSLAIAYIFVLGLVKDYGVNLFFAKILADFCVFLINFSIQKVIVFPQMQRE